MVHMSIIEKFEWKQLNGDTWIIICDENEKTLTVLDKDTNDIISKHEDLSKDALKLLKDSFLNIVSDNKTETNDYNPMYA